MILDFVFYSSSWIFYTEIKLDTSRTGDAGPVFTLEIFPLGDAVPVFGFKIFFTLCLVTTPFSFLQKLELADDSLIGL